MKRRYLIFKENDIITCRNPLCSYKDEAWWFGIKEYNKTAGRVTPFYHQTCPMCRQTSKDEEKRKDRTLTKASDLMGRKAKKFGVSSSDMVSLYGWPTSRELADLIKRVYNGNCHYCQNPYIEMEHGLGDVSLDQRDRSINLPYWDNFILCCNTCNRIKGTMSPERWAAWLAKTRARNHWFKERQKQVAQPLLIPYDIPQTNPIRQKGEYQASFNIN